MVPLVIVTVLVVVGILTLVVLSHRREWKMTSFTAGRVNRCEERELRDAQQRREQTIVVVTYRVAGRDYQIEQILSGRLAWRYAPGTPVEVRYNPAEPAMAMFE